MKFLVPYDFTEITRTALDHALGMAPVFDAEIELFHVIKNEKNRAEAEQKLEELIGSLPAEKKARVSFKIQMGNIFKDIAKQADEGDADLMVMGTHGAKGLQKILGSNAIKVVNSSSTPFIITQTKGPKKDIRKIVMAVNLTKESVQIVKFASQLAQKFKAEIHLLCQPQKDEFLAKRLNNNITRARQFLVKEDVSYQVEMLDGKDSFAQEVTAYSQANDADLFAVVHYTESLIPQFDNFSQAMITNDLETPVLILNGSEMKGVKTKYSFISI